MFTSLTATFYRKVQLSRIHLKLWEELLSLWEMTHSSNSLQQSWHYSKLEIPIRPSEYSLQVIWICIWNQISSCIRLDLSVWRDCFSSQDPYEVLSSRTTAIFDLPLFHAYWSLNARAGRSCTWEHVQSRSVGRQSWCNSLYLLTFNITHSNLSYHIVTKFANKGNLSYTGNFLGVNNWLYNWLRRSEEIKKTISVDFSSRSPCSSGEALQRCNAICVSKKRVFQMSWWSGPCSIW